MLRRLHGLVESFCTYEEKDKTEIERLERIRKDIVNPLMKLKSDIDNDKTAEGISKSIYKFLVEENMGIIM